jgi:surface polysaccharide O-acyltransferase-like enzyme
MTKERQSNFELMRIISMFFIALWHFILFGNMIDNTSGLTHILVIFISAILLVHVNSFVLLTGYFNYDKEFKLSKVIRINNMMWIYNAVILLGFIIFTTEYFSKTFIILDLSPIPKFYNYWFLIVYMILYLFSPVLNVVIRNIDKTKHRNIIIALMIISFLAYITGDNFININAGYSLLSFIMLYFMGSYLHKYPIDLKKHKRNKVIILSFILFIVFALCNVLLYYFGHKYMLSSNNLVKHYAEIIFNNFASYNNPFIVFGSLAYFIFFSQIKIKNRVINFASRYVIGLYLITQNTLMYRLIYPKLGFNLESYNYKHILIAIGYSIILLIICTLIEFIRSKIFEFFYNRKIAKKNRENIQKFINKIGLNVKW